MLAFKWQLTYRDGSVLNELEKDSSISIANGGAISLAICHNDRDRTELLSIDLPDGWLPIFYRIKQIEMKIGIYKSDTEDITTITIFGRYNKSLDTCELYEWETNKISPTVCRESFVDTQAIRVCVSKHIEVVS